MPAPKKSFKEDINPAMQFISPPSLEAGPEASEAGNPPAGHKANPLYIETKSRRVQLLMQPSLHKKLKDRADSEGTSLNELVHSLLDNALKKR